MQTLRVNNSRILTMKNAKLSGYYFYMNLNIWWDFQICIRIYLKINTAWHSSSVFIVDFDHSRHINIVLLLLTLNKYLSVGCQMQVIMFWKHKRRYICFVIKVTRPISFSDLSLDRIEINCEQMTMLWTYYENNIKICFSSKFAPGISSVYHCFLPFFWSALTSWFPRDWILFCCIKPKTYLNHWKIETNW